MHCHTPSLKQQRRPAVCPKPRSDPGWQPETYSLIRRGNLRVSRIVLTPLVIIAHPGGRALSRAMLGRLTGMILGMSLGGFSCMLLRVLEVRVRQMGVVADLLVAAGVVLFGCLTVVARGLLVVLCCCFVVFCSCSGDGEIRRFCAV